MEVSCVENCSKKRFAKLAGATGAHLFLVLGTQLDEWLRGLGSNKPLREAIPA